ncbi:MAG: hypothetical protein SVR94_04155 [Pseudomonadota bacterium]|nr:hypothetical protein [Pseudomonadota bacterium]
MIIKRFFLKSLLWAWIPAAQGQQFVVSPNLFLSSRNFEYSVGNGGVNGTIQSLGGGISGIYKNFYFDLSAEKNIHSSEESTTNLLSTQRVAFDRTDFALSLGYAVNEAISLFSGYKYGKSTITAIAPSPFEGGKITLEGKGIFLGAGGGFLVSHWGAFSFSSAFAYMVSDYKDLAIGTTEGDAAGTSLSVKWKGHLFSKNWYYEMGISRHDYYYEDFKKFDLDISEQILSYRLGLSYRF